MKKLDAYFHALIVKWVGPFTQQFHFLSYYGELGTNLKWLVILNKNKTETIIETSEPKNHLLKRKPFR